jgi:hypothetical protein
MTKQKMHMYRSETLLLSPLKLVLTNARKDLPPYVLQKDVNEELALKLIGKMKTEYRKVFRGMVKANV